MADTDLARVRLVLLRELETINHYEELARAADSEEIRAFFLHLAEEEKEHVAEATFLMRKLDPGQEAHFAKDFSAAHFQGAPPAPAPARPPPPPASATVSARPQPDGPLEHVRIPTDPRRVLTALPAVPHPAASPFTVGPLKRGGPKSP